MLRKIEEGTVAAVLQSGVHQRRRKKHRYQLDERMSFLAVWRTCDNES